MVSIIISPKIPINNGLSISCVIILIVHSNTLATNSLPLSSDQTVSRCFNNKFRLFSGKSFSSVRLFRLLTSSDVG